MHLTIDWVAAAILLGMSSLFLMLKKRASGKQRLPSFAFSQIRPFSKQTNWRQRLAQVPFWLNGAALAFFAAAFINPALLVPKRAGQQVVTGPALKGSAIYLALDRSGSMGEQVEGNQTKLALLKKNHVAIHFAPRV